ncbi:MAG: hypothetical protein IKM11_02005 [Oscillospiraceae bacterium]|nr:hypothetical protein [Oscillospiraceae bacterium]
MKTIIDTAIELLNADERVSDHKINVHRKEGYELYFVKGKLETVRRTNVRDIEVTVYVDHGEFRGESQFLIYAYTTEDNLHRLIDEAVARALLINNKHYTLPENEQGGYDIESNFRTYHMPDLAAAVAQAVFEANTIENTSLNSVEIFINEHLQTIINSRGIHKEQRYFSAMLETIPTYNGSRESVELYHQYNFSSFDRDTIVREVRDMLLAAKARYEAITPDFSIDCPVILNKQEVYELMGGIALDLDFSSVYSRSNLFKKGDAIQTDPTGDRIGITMAGAVKGSIYSRKFDADGLSLHDTRIVEDGKAVSYYGGNRFAQYLGETPTGALACVCVDAGSVSAEDFSKGPYLEIISMSGLQVDFYSDYIGGEVRLAYYHDGEKITPVTGISITGKLREVLGSIRLSADTAVKDGYVGPAKALLTNMKIF